MADIYEDRLRGSHEILKMRYGNSEKLAVPEDQMFIGFDAYKKAISAADVVLLTTPTFWRPLHYEEAVSQGKHIFMEKPVAVDAPGVRRVLQAARVARQKELNVVVGLQRRYSSKYREIYNRIQDGAIGDILSGSVYCSETIVNGANWICRSATSSSSSGPRADRYSTSSFTISTLPTGISEITRNRPRVWVDAMKILPDPM
jgi:predicted dehydrogenase